MATLKDFRDERLRKLADLKELGINPYPAETIRTHTNKEVLDNFDSLEGKEVSAGADSRLCWQRNQRDASGVIVPA